jgi:hypothetical protein
MKICAFFSVFFALIAVAHAQSNNPLERANFRLHDRHTNRLSLSSNEFRLIETINHTPLFDNLPFLKLRAGDQIVRAQFLYRPYGKGMKAEAPLQWSRPSLFLQRGEKRKQLSAFEEEGKLQLRDAREIPYFEWEPTRQNADALFGICQPEPRVSLAQLAKLDAELQPEFAEYLGGGLEPLLKENANVSLGFLYEVREGNDLKWVYGGLAYNGNEREIFQFRITLGVWGWREERALLISAPPRPSYRAFAPQQTPLNANRDLLPRDSVLRRRIEAQNARCLRFDAIVARVVNPQD